MDWKETESHLIHFRRGGSNKVVSIPWRPFVLFPYFFSFVQDVLLSVYPIQKKKKKSIDITQHVVYDILSR